MKHITMLFALPAVSIAVSALSRRTVDPRIGRGRLLALGGAGLAAVATARWRARAATAAGICVLAPEQTQGPYYIAKEKVRSNITERRAGRPLALKLAVVDAVKCAPIKNAAVDIWHCDAGGIYSGFEAASAGGPGGSGPTDKDTFLRGIQYTDAHGVCKFQTIYPGWYRGRTTHIHVMVHVGGTIVHTGQLYFPDSLTDKVYLTAPYSSHPGRDTRNSTDGIYSNGGPQSTLALKRTSKGGYTTAITLGVRRA